MTTHHQPQLFKSDVPQMPEGYYSSGPNPNLRRFVEEHATPYDPETDAYDVPPFDKPIKSTKATAIYNMHTYWSKKPHKAIQQYVRHYTEPGELVLDPFCGSGSTALATLMERRTAIAIDLSPAATFITKNYCTAVDVDELQNAFRQLTANVKSEIDWLYETRCDRCDGRATTAYTVYSYVFQCPRCLEKTPLFDCIQAEGTTPAAKPKKISACPHCYAQGYTEEINTRTCERYDSVPVLVSYDCDDGCTPKRDQRAHNDPDPKKRTFFRNYDLGKLQAIEAKAIPHWTPPHRMMNVESDTEPWGDEWRPGRDFRTVAELFTRRNLWALAALHGGIGRINKAQDALRFAFNAIALNCSRMYRYRTNLKGGFQAGTYYLPQESQIINVWNAYANKVLDILRGLEDLNVTESLAISTQSATDLSNIPSRTIDYIFTDPPYAGKVQYGELNFIWEAWLGFDTYWHDQEIIINESRGKTDADWANMMRQAMSECYRVLKPGRWISLCYHDTSEGTWQLLQDMMAEIGFIPEQSDTALYIDTDQKSFNQLMAEKVTRRDLVINFRKPRPGEATQLVLLGDEDERTFAEKARAILRDALDAKPGAPADRLYDELVSRMVRRGAFERHNFDQLLHSVAEAVDGRWYLLETADQVDEAESAREEAAAARLETYIRNQVFSEKPGFYEEGVHYSDLFEQYLPVADKPRRLLQDWLPEFFFKTPEGTWRPPANDEERAQKTALRTSGALRRIKRFTRALQEGVPPAEHDRPGNPATAADWIRQCRRAGLYDLGRILYEKGGFRFNDLGDLAQMEVEEDYQICVRRS